MIPDCDGAIDSDRMILEVKSYASTGWAANHLHLITCGSVRQASGLSRIAGRTRPTLGLGAGRAPRCEHAVSATTASAEIETGGFTGMGVRATGIDVTASAEIETGGFTGMGVRTKGIDVTASAEIETGGFTGMCVRTKDPC